VVTSAITLSAPAKINLFLHILGRRSDGYHQLQSVFQFLDFADQLSFELTPDRPSVTISPSIADVPAADNLIMKAAQLLRQEHHQTSQRELPGVHIQLQKRIPMGGGLGGGSSDAATTLLALRQLWQLDISDARLAALGLKLGADVPVFLFGQAAFAEGVGEKLQPVAVPPHWYLVIHPGVHVSTADIFQHPNLPRATPPISAQQWQFDQTHNDCQQLVGQLHPEVANAIAWLLEYAPARLTGTGACVFGCFTSQTEALRVLESVPTHWNAFVAQGLQESPVRQQLRQALQSEPTTKAEV